jgi:glutathione reductase (NADPH)
MNTFDFDLLVMGGGSGGVRAARMAAQRGVRVALVEMQGVSGLGGTCVNVGCIPKKLYSYAAHYAEGFEEAHGYGWEGAAPTLNWQTLKTRRAAEIIRLNGVYAQMLRGAGVTLIDAFARLEGGHAVGLAGLNADGSPNHRSVTARHILIATGGRPHVPHFQGREAVVTSNEMFDLPQFPHRLVVVGGGYIASEFASIFKGLGAHVTQLYRGEQILRGFDDEVRYFLAAEMQKAGVDLRLNAGVLAVRRESDGLKVDLEDGHTLHADAVLYATGRTPLVDGLGLDAVGVAQGPQGAIVVNDHYQTNVPHIYAVGDVTARVQLTPVALGEAMVVVDHLYGPATGKPLRQMGYDLIPTAVFTHPNVGTVGLTEAQARERYGAVHIFRSEFRALKHTLSGSTERTLMKLIVTPADDRVVGLHMVGADAGEIVQGFAVAMKAGATKAVFDSTIGIHPTAAEEFVTMREPVNTI